MGYEVSVGTGVKRLFYNLQSLISPMCLALLEYKLTLDPVE